MELEEPCVTSNSLFCFLQREQTVLLIGDKTGWNTEGDFNIAGIHRDFS